MTEAHREGEATDVADTADVVETDVVEIEVDGTVTEMDVAETVADGTETVEDRRSKPQRLPSSQSGQLLLPRSGRLPLHQSEQPLPRA